MENNKNPESYATYDLLYINMSDYKEKRKSLLLSLKTSLVAQEEYEKILEIRRMKAAVLSEIKKELEAINSDYQQIRKIVPNVKNVLAFTEKELHGLSTEEKTLKSSMKVEQKEVKDIEELKEGLDEDIVGSKGVSKYVKSRPKSYHSNKGSSTKKKQKVETKYDRIKNNLGVIEDKLKHI